MRFQAFITLLAVAVVVALVVGCKGNKKVSNNSRRNNYTQAPATGNGNQGHKAEAVIKAARSYMGVKYKYGGTTRAGLDCSGLMYVSFKQAGYTIPRISRDQATVGHTIRLADVKPGDLLFFSTSGKARRGINHVGLVTNTNNGTNVQFIHASTSVGVTISSMNVSYYQKTFVKAVHPKFY